MLSKTAIHTLRAMTALAKLPAHAFAGAAEVADAIGAPPNYLGKLLKSLAEEGLVQSQKGKGGGFRLAHMPKAITVLDVIEPIDHISRWKGCFLGRSRCSEQSPCAVHVRWAAIRDQYLAFLKHTTLADLVQQPERSMQLV